MYSDFRIFVINNHEKVQSNALVSAADAFIDEAAFHHGREFTTFFLNSLFPFELFKVSINSCVSYVWANRMY